MAASDNNHTVYVRVKEIEMAEAEEEASLLSKGSDSIFDIYCELCHEDGLHVEAEGFCTNCKEYLCGQCITHHEKTRLTRYHELLDKDNMPKQPPVSLDRERKDISTICNIHRGKAVEFYCKSHDSLVCSLCFAAHHRLCDNVDNITEVSQAIFDKKEYKDFKHHLESLKQQVDDVIENKLRFHRADLDASSSWAFEMVMEFRREIESRLEELEIDLEKQIDENKHGNVIGLDFEEERFLNLKDSLDKKTSDLESLHSARQVCQTFIFMKEAKTDIENIENWLKRVNDDKSIEPIEFVPNKELQKFLTHLNALGSIKTEQRVGQTNSSATNAISSGSFAHDIYIRSTNDRNTCTITGSALLSDSRLVIIDYSNYAMKLIDTTLMKPISEHEMPKFPWDVVAIESNMVAVTLPNRNTIAFFNVTKTDTILFERKIKVKAHCEGIAYCNNHLVVTYVYPAKLEIMDLQGNVNYKIKGGNGVDRLFDYPQYVCVGSDGNTLYVSDCDDGRLVCLKEYGDARTVCSVYTDPSLRCAQKVCADHRGNLYVCGYESRNIHVLKPDCTKLDVIPTDIQDVHSVSHCHKTDRLYVGMNWCDIVRVFQLS